MGRGGLYGATICVDDLGQGLWSGRDKPDPRGLAGEDDLLEDTNQQGAVCLSNWILNNGSHADI